MNSKNFPTLDLSDLYKSIDDPQIKKDLAAYKELNIEFAKKYQDKLATLIPDEAFEMLSLYENKENIGRLLGDYAWLMSILNGNDQIIQTFAKNIEELLVEYSLPAAFFLSEFSALPQIIFDNWLANAKLQFYAPAIRHLNKMKKHKLSEGIEKVLEAKKITSNYGWQRLYHAKDKIIKFSKTRFEIDKINRFYVDVNEKIRAEIDADVDSLYAERSYLLSFIYNMLIKDRHIENDLRGFTSQLAKQNWLNSIDDNSVELLTAVIHKNYFQLSNRLYKLKAKILNVKKLPSYNLRSPLLPAQERILDWQEGVENVLATYKSFSPEVYKIVKKMFSNNWIEIQADDKPFFAIIYPLSGNKHPVVICTWTGTGYSFYGLVHELGHACNHFLSKKQGELNDNTSLAYSEIASIFFENLAFNFLLGKENDKQKRLCIIVDYLQYLMYYLCFLMADHSFELRTYEERKSGELTEERLREIWLEEQRAACGEYVEYNDAKGNDWLSQFRFFVQPFSCYGYAFAECIVCNLYQVYRNKSVPDFEDKFLTFLSETGIKDYKELLAPFGLDPTKDEFWQRGVNVVVEYIDEAERLAKELGLL